MKRLIAFSFAAGALLTPSLSRAAVISCDWKPVDELLTLEGVKQNPSVWKQIGDSYLECFGERGDHQEGWVSLAALDAADVGPVMFRPGGELLLAPAPIEAELSQPLTTTGLAEMIFKSGGPITPSPAKATSTATASPMATTSSSGNCS